MAIRVTSREYETFQVAYDLFNAELFDGQLAGALITLQRKAGATGYYSKGSFISRQKDGRSMDEIAINPDSMSYYPDDVEIWQTLLHEMVHQWQCHHGKPSRGGYHNKEFAMKMREIGLMPSDTGSEGGKQTGQHMADYPIAGGEFLRCVGLLNEQNIRVNWESLTAATMEVQIPAMIEAGHEEQAAEYVASIAMAESKKKSKSKYSCPSCGLNAWGKPDMNLLCGDCNLQML